MPRIQARDRVSAGTIAQTFRQSITHAFINPPFRMVVFSCMFSNLASALLANLGLIVFTYTFGLGGDRIALILGVQFLLPLSMVADMVDLDEAGGGNRNNGVYFGSLTLVYKLSQAVAIIMIGSMLDITGIDSRLPRQEISTLVSLGLILSFGGTASFMAAIACRRTIAEGKASVTDAVITF
ncbi:MAG: hypothetical protein E4H20_07650 [Spirochaetales bacterium]|nr:MAG: hypothetical protein E4H20_07650 [Spirochaetales bacterium]